MRDVLEKRGGNRVRVMAINLHNVVFEGKCDRDGVEFKSRSGQVVQGKDLVGPHGGDEEASSSSWTCLPWGV